MARNSSGSQGENGRAGDGNAQREPATAKSGNGQAGSGPGGPEQTTARGRNGQADNGRASARRVRRVDRSLPTSSSSGDYGDAFPNSRKVFVDGPRGMRVPMREISLSGGEPPLRVYDTSGPQETDVRQGIPRLRAEWIAERGGVGQSLPQASLAPEGANGAEMPAALHNRPLRSTGGPVTQLQYAAGVRSRARWSSSPSARA